MKSGSRDRAGGFVDKAAGRILEAFSKLTGRRSAGDRPAQRARRLVREAAGGRRRAAPRSGPVGFDDEPVVEGPCPTSARFGTAASR
jgi:hypothetical protein